MIVSASSFGPLRYVNVYIYILNHTVPVPAQVQRFSTRNWVRYGSVWIGKIAPHNFPPNYLILVCLEAMRECCHGNVMPPVLERANFGNISQNQY